MKAKFGAIVVDGRGKLGGHVASKNRSGSYFRTKVTPVNPQSVFQSAVRTAFSGFSQAWSGLTQAVRDAWNGAVSDWQTTDVFGDLKKPTGKNLFLRLNQQATQAGFPSFTDVPAKGEIVGGVVSAATISIGLAVISLTDLGATVGENIQLLATPPMSQGTSFVKNRVRLIGSFPASTYAGADGYSAYIARFGAPAANDNIYIGVRYVLASGQASPIQYIKADVSA